MTITNRLGRPMLAAMFVRGGADQLLHPESKADVAAPVVEELSDRVEAVPIPDDTADAVRINGAVQLVAGGLLAINRMPRLAATALAASLVPTTLAAHRYWEIDDEEQRAQQQIHFFKNLAMLGGLVITIGDTGREPSLGWRARRAARRARSDVAGSISGTAGDVRRSAKDLRRSTAATASDVAGSIGGAAAAATAALPTASAAGPDFSSAADDARDFAKGIRDASEPARKAIRRRAKDLASSLRSVDVSATRDGLADQARDLAERAAALSRTAAAKLPDVKVPEVKLAR